MTTPQYITTPPPQYTIVVTKGSDAAFNLDRVDTNSNPVNWGGSVVINILFGRNCTTTVSAIVTANTAAFVIPSATADQCHNSTLFQIIWTPSGGNPTAVVVGQFCRDDGYSYVASSPWPT